MDKIDAAEQSVVDFRNKFAMHQYIEIYRSSSSGMKNAISEDAFVKMADEASKDLGAFQSATPKDRIVKYQIIGGPRIVLTYESKYSNSKFIINESFAFDTENEEIMLSGYHYGKGKLISDEINISK